MELAPGIQPSKPYSPSWIDRLTAWVDRLPGPYWAYYFGFGLLLFALQTGIKWWDQTDPVGTFQLRYLDYTLWGMYVLAAVHYLDWYARQALKSFRPALDPAANYEQLEYQLTTSSPAKTLLSSLLFVLWGLISTFWNPVYVQAMKVYTSPLATALELPIVFAYYAITGAALYHVVHQLAMVSRIYTVSTRIDPLSPQPLYSLAGLSARTALASIGVQYFFVATTPGILTSGMGSVNTVLVVLLAGSLLLWPLWGAHRLLLKEKLRLQAEAQARMKMAINDLHQQMDQRDYSRIDGLNKAMNSLQIELSVLEKLPTWPWHPDTPRLLLTAILLPLAVWLAQRILGKLGI